MMSIKRNKPFSLLIKPISGKCNLACTYCFYSAMSDFLSETTDNPNMTEYTASILTASYLDTYQKEYIFAWQGGEPTLMGLDFYRYIIQLQMRYGKCGDTIANAIQTNGALLTKEWAKFLSQYNFLVGISLDGPPKIHNQYRKYKNGYGTCADVMRAISLLKTYNISFNSLTLISAANVRKAKTVFDFLCNEGIHYQQYIPCVEISQNGYPMPFSIEPEDWGVFLCEIFDEWIKFGVGKVSIRLFDSLINYYVSGYHQQCTNTKLCNQYFVVEYNGDVFPCDFFVTKELKVGNVFSDSWQEMTNSTVYREFSIRKSALSRDCALCSYIDFCGGDCPKYRCINTSMNSNLSRLCNGWKIFYEHALPQISKISEAFSPCH